MAVAFGEGASSTFYVSVDILFYVDRKIHFLFFTDVFLDVRIFLIHSMCVESSFLDGSDAL